jgi:hypothetical protein
MILVNPSYYLFDFSEKPKSLAANYTNYREYEKKNSRELAKFAARGFRVLGMVAT